ncbi:MAG: ribonuclease Z [Candidatus Omnitrophota bacterium]
MPNLLVLGSGTGIPNVKRGAPGYLLTAKGKNILLDSGPGTLQRLIRYGVTYQDIDYILYTHFHPDHTLDLAAILFAARNGINPRKKDLVVIGPRGFNGFYDRLLALYPTAINPQSYKFVVKEMEEGELDIGGLKIRTKPVAHAEGSVGFRIDISGGSSLAYSGDTDYCENMVKLARRASLLILECSAPDEYKVAGHLTPSIAGKIASLADPKKLLLSHLYPICDRYPILRQCRKHFKNKVMIAKDGMNIKF